MTAQPNMKVRDRRVYIGGLFRCCSAVLGESHDMTAIGDELTCPYCQRVLIVNSEGIWKDKDNKHCPD